MPAAVYPLPRKTILSIFIFIFSKHEIYLGLSRSKLPANIIVGSATQFFSKSTCQFQPNSPC